MILPGEEHATLYAVSDPVFHCSGGTHIDNHVRIDKYENIKLLKVDTSEPFFAWITYEDESRELRTVMRKAECLYTDKDEVLTLIGCYLTQVRK